MPTPFEWHDGDHLEPGYHLESYPSAGLLTAGLILFGAPYVTGLIAGASDGFHNQKGWLFVPGVGPWVALGERPKRGCNSYEDCDDVAGPILLLVDGLTQVTGLILVGAAFGSATTWQVPNGQVSVRPAVSSGRVGAVATGTF